MAYEHRSPAGVFGLITPWNMPLYLLTWKIAPCLAFGCVAVAKPSEVTSVTAFCKSTTDPGEAGARVFATHLTLAKYFARYSAKPSSLPA